MGLRMTALVVPLTLPPVNDADDADADADDEDDADDEGAWTMPKMAGER